MRVVLAGLYLGKVVEAKFISFGSGITVPCLEQAHDVFVVVAPPVGAVGVIRCRRRPLDMGSQRGVRINGYLQVAGQDVEQEAVVCGTLYVGLTPHGVNTATGDTNVTQQELQYGVGPDILSAVGVLGSAHGIQDCTGFTGGTGRGICLRH